jgi:hypothetical protein
MTQIEKTKEEKLGGRKYRKIVDDKDSKDKGDQRCTYIYRQCMFKTLTVHYSVVLTGAHDIGKSIHSEMSDDPHAPPYRISLLRVKGVSIEKM